MGTVLVFTDDAGSGYNDSNAFALPSKSEAVLRKNRKNDLEPVGKILSKRRRKHLEKIVEKKAKKENRAELLQRLETNQVSEDYLEKMTSLSKVSTPRIHIFLVSQSFHTVKNSTV